MPEMTVSVRWPDGRSADLYSPSLVMHDHLSPGATYTVDEFVKRASTALGIASERVRAKYGFACTSAAATRSTVRPALVGTVLGSLAAAALFRERHDDQRTHRPR